MFGETTIFYLMIWNHPVETTMKNWLFGVPGKDSIQNSFGKATFHANFWEADAAGDRPGRGMPTCGLFKRGHP